MLSAAAQLLNIDSRNPYGGNDLLQQRSEEAAELERKRRLAAQNSFSPAGYASLGLLSQGMQ